LIFEIKRWIANQFPTLGVAKTKICESTFTARCRPQEKPCRKSVKWNQAIDGAQNKLHVYFKTNSMSYIKLNLKNIW